MPPGNGIRARVGSSPPAENRPGGCTPPTTKTNPARWMFSEREQGLHASRPQLFLTTRKPFPSAHGARRGLGGGVAVHAPEGLPSESFLWTHGARRGGILAARGEDVEKGLKVSAGTDATSVASLTTPGWPWLGNSSWARPGGP